MNETNKSELISGKIVYAVWIDFLDSTELVGLSATLDYAKIIKNRLRKNSEDMKVDIVKMKIGKMESIFLPE